MLLHHPNCFGWLLRCVVAVVWFNCITGGWNHTIDKLGGVLWWWWCCVKTFTSWLFTLIGVHGGWENRLILGHFYDWLAFVLVAVISGSVLCPSGFRKFLAYLNKNSITMLIVRNCRLAPQQFCQWWNFLLQLSVDVKEIPHF